MKKKKRIRCPKCGCMTLIEKRSKRTEKELADMAADYFAVHPTKTSYYGMRKPLYSAREVSERHGLKGQACVSVMRNWLRRMATEKHREIAGRRCDDAIREAARKYRPDITPEYAVKNVYYWFLEGRTVELYIYEAMMEKPKLMRGGSK